MKIKKAISCILCASLICASLTACGDGITNEVKDQITTRENEAIVTQVVQTLSATGTSDAKKEETVYVKTSATGEVDSVIVSNWLKNTDNAAELTDATELTDIKNVKGKETYTVEGTSLVWDSQGSDIYYQGTIDKEIPVSVNISYELNGKAVTPEELAGQSGHVTITVNYTNNSVNTVVLNGKEETIYTPFVAVSGMIIDQSKFSNVEVSNGTVISDGNRNIVVGMAFPGLVESLNGGDVENNDVLEEIEEKVNIPGKVVVEADVTDFEIGMTLTMVSSDVTKALGLDSISVDTDESVAEVKDKIQEFSDAGNSLAEGTESLADGAEKLSNGSKDLVAGTENLHNGIVEYTEGVDKVADGAGKLHEGAGELENGIGQVSEGINKLDDGVNQVNDGAKQLSDGAASAVTGAENLADGAKQVSEGVNSLTGQLQNITTGVGTASGAATQISGGINAIVAATANPTTADDIDVSGINVSGALSDEQLAGIVAAITGNMSDEVLKTTYGLTDDQITAVKGMVAMVASSVLPSVADNIATSAAQTAAKTAGAKAANETKNQINAALTQPATEGGVSLQSGATQLALSLSTSYATLSSEETQAQVIALARGAAELATGADTLSTGIKSLKSGADSLYAGTNSLSTGSAQLRAGIGRLNTGVSTLKEGTGALASGANELSSNSSKLVDGSKTLAEGTVTLQNGIESLKDGTVKLNEGMVQFNEEGISKLTDAFDTDLSSMTDRIRAISDAGKEYTTFSGTKDTEDCSVKFIIETAAIKK